MSSADRDNLDTILRAKYATYVLITCSKPDSDGFMDVEMTYEGEALHIAYLLEDAKNVIDEEAMQEL